MSSNSPENIAASLSLFEVLKHGGITMIILVICSLVVWAVIFERLWQYRRLTEELKGFHLQALNALLRRETGVLRTLCKDHERLPTARLVTLALERLEAKDVRIREKWREALERRRQLLNQELRRNLWILGTIGSAAPFIGLFGTVVGILESFQNIARTGSGGFAVVAAGISEALIATAAGIAVAVVAVMSYNAFQTRWSALVLMIRVHIEELAEMLEARGSDGA